MRRFTQDEPDDLLESETGLSTAEGGLTTAADKMECIDPQFADHLRELRDQVRTDRYHVLQVLRDRAGQSRQVA